MIGRVVDNLHVSQSNRDVIRAIRGALKPRHRRARGDRAARHRLYRDGIARHHRNREVYRTVMGGFLG